MVVERRSAERAALGKTHCQPQMRAAPWYFTDSASGSHSMIYIFDRVTGNFSGPIWAAAAEGMPKTLDGLDVIAP